MRITPLKIESQSQAADLMQILGVSKEGIDILSSKSTHIAFKIEGISSWEANIIKQHLLSLGSDSAINRDALIKDIKTATLIFGSISQLRKLCEKLKVQPFKLRQISESISLSLDNLFKESFIFRARTKTLRINKPVLCGIINVTPDSFSGDGILAKSKRQVNESALKIACGMVRAGAKIIDIGAESSRPFAKPISQSQELKRLIPIVKTLRKKLKGVFISIDTYKYKVAKEALDQGADIINDITALRKAPRIADLVKKYKAGCILMHMKGTPKTMQKNPSYSNVTDDIIDFFKERLDFCTKKHINREQIMLDPGIGFGKRLEDNFKIINELYKFKMFGLPIFLGLSRKSFIGKTLGLDVDRRLNGTIAANVFALSRGANVLRVHDVRENFQAAKLFSKLNNN